MFVFTFGNVSPPKVEKSWIWIVGIHSNNSNMQRISDSGWIWPSSSFFCWAKHKDVRESAARRLTFTVHFYLAHKTVSRDKQLTTVLILGLKPGSFSPHRHSNDFTDGFICSNWSCSSKQIIWFYLMIRSRVEANSELWPPGRCLINTVNAVSLTACLHLKHHRNPTWGTRKHCEVNIVYLSRKLKLKGPEGSVQKLNLVFINIFLETWKGQHFI